MTEPTSEDLRNLLEKHPQLTRRGMDSRGDALTDELGKIQEVYRLLSSYRDSLPKETANQSPVAEQLRVKAPCGTASRRLRAEWCVHCSGAAVWLRDASLRRHPKR